METKTRIETKKDSFLISKRESLLYDYGSNNIYNLLYPTKNNCCIESSSGSSGNDSHGVMGKRRIWHEPDGRRIILSRRAKHRRKP
ncbi:MAG: hypothetical protein M0Q91_07540 [Methanoregula sp.]|nr:hypothetical protein [Methanoregula sp.]